MCAHDVRDARVAETTPAKLHDESSQENAFVPRSRLQQMHVWRLEHLPLRSLDIFDVHRIGTLFLRPRDVSRAEEIRVHGTLSVVHVLFLSLELLLLLPDPRLCELSSTSTQLEHSSRVS